MRTLTLLLLLCALGDSQRASAQDTEPPDGTRIEAAEVLGFPTNDLSPGLQRDIEALGGDALSRARVSELARRIEEERPDVVVAARIDARPGGEARVIFLVARISDDGRLVENINARYVVESVEIQGLPEKEISAGLRDRLQALVGGRLDPDQADELIKELKAERPGYDVTRRIERGTKNGQIRVVFEFSETEELRWIPFTRSRSKYVYHSGEGWSGLQDIPMGNRDHRVTVGLAFDDNDTLVEEYSGVRLRFETRNIGTERVGVSLEASWLNTSWRPETLLVLGANPAIPEPYRNRLTVEPKFTVAFTRHLRATGGLSVSDLEALHHSPDTQMASAVVGSLAYARSWNPERQKKQTVEASYELRSSVSGLGSEFDYTRHLGHASYRFDGHHNTVVADVFVGGITGAAPLFERFTLGDSATLRGWNKFELAPAGGDRVFHQSLEYRLYGAAIFLDTGSVWNDGTDSRLRASTGFGFHLDNFFATVAFPLDAPRADVAFMIGVRF